MNQWLYSMKKLYHDEICHHEVYNWEEDYLYNQALLTGELDEPFDWWPSVIRRENERRKDEVWLGR